MDNQNQADAGGQAGAQGQGLPQGAPAGWAELGAQVGAQLAALREKRGMSIEDVSARLKVSVQKLKRLEAGEWDALPEMPFIQGVVRSYARMVGGDPEPMIESLRRVNATPHTPIDIPQPQSGQPSIPKSPVRFRSPVAASQAKWPWALAALVLIAGAAWYFGNSHKGGRGGIEPAELASGASAQGTTEAAEPASQPVVADANGTPPGADGATGTNAANNGNTESTVNNASASAAAAGPGLIAAVDPTHVVAGLASAAAAPVAASAAPADAKASSAGAPGNGKIALRLKADSWVEVRSKDGKVLFSQLMRAGAEQEITGDTPFKVVVGNVAGVESLEFNGQPVEIKSRNAGNVARLTLQ
ncbi:helix-turn-helix domain-containing protein [Pandoraea anhela]|uniref:Cytoskeleton protein RodZ n=1 Tax=Pandoraea anhela TaxID=2508295 RepID=A0A5E4TQS5_9BURK|nr:RodZ domain-containing protein [Pandoraea anhela]VVD88964.1 Cytoskeleton protein RodZ [Pandoraea anhela]